MSDICDSSNPSLTLDFTMTYRILFVCMGNICRSPTADGVLRQRLREAFLEGVVSVDSAGTHAYHVGEPPDARSQKHALARGYDLSPLRARKLVAEDVEQFDLILTMDWDNQHLTESICGASPRIRRFAEFFQRHTDTVVPDPYAGGAAGFEQVLDLVEDGCEGLLRHLATPAVLNRCLPEWRHLPEERCIERAWRWPDFRAAMAFLQQVAAHADAQDHHPEIWNVYNQVRLRLSTHDAQGLTHKDLALAAAIDRLESPA